MSRAYHKLREILYTCALPPPRASVHLCEAPGGFVQAARDAAEGEGDGPAWRWRALSLAGGDGGAPVPHPDVASDARGRFLEGDVLAAEADAGVRALLEHCAATPADLVTADGAVEMDHARLERDTCRCSSRRRGWRSRASARAAT